MGGPRPRLSWALTCPPLVSREKLASPPTAHTLPKVEYRAWASAQLEWRPGKSMVLVAVGGGGHGGEAATTRPAILAACSLSEVKLV